MLILALTDSFPNHDPNNVSRAQELVARLPSEYERAYFAAWWPNAAPARC